MEKKITAEQENLKAKIRSNIEQVLLSDELSEQEKSELFDRVFRVCSEETEKE